jgi:hypothetical protein
MASCERCWGDAFVMSLGGGDHVDIYHRLVKERPPCSPQEQAGQWWDEATQRDRRTPAPIASEGDEQP